MLIEDFNNTIDFWLDELNRYTYSSLCTKPSSNSWSIGQLYLHLINDTRYYLEQINICLSNNDNKNEEASSVGKQLFLNNAFPDEIIEGAPSNAFIPQPDNKEQLRNGLIDLKDEINKAGLLISSSTYKGKTKHPGLNYFNANEWLQFGEMHFRHHLRQKKRIDDFLKSNYV